ncbi:hypothetical protein H6F98_29955 [Microcoleus sp. FACHB-SPT15]|uniref:hypothetical protein n=1 Tax=Microcoleus sp. FACHB-SPT15 TaxID=2692830 RepID=UPI00177AD8C7|nr:hypothetical protein [Microcoleus sp. FACHB-SPT15]MBD1809644.1 hypothetical protein [Microcoleus sp. FACHB-SPT15]
MSSVLVGLNRLELLAGNLSSGWTFRLFALIAGKSDRTQLLAKKLLQGRVAKCDRPISITTTFP